MTARGPTRERLAAAAAKAGLDPEELLAVLDAPGAASASEPSPGPAAPRSDSAIRAAISDTFTHAELAAGAASDGIGEEASRAEIDSVLARAAPVLLGGERRLRLLPEARREIITRSGGTDRFEQLLKKARWADADSLATASAQQRPSIWLRRFLAGRSEPLEHLSLPDLAAAATALEALAGIPIGTAIPEASEARRLLDFAHLVEPLKILVGASDPRAGGSRSDRFVGRSDELARLRAYVDELDSENRWEMVTRGIARVGSAAAQAFHGQSPGPYVLEARGGLGKSTLIAKFVLDHALAQGEHPSFAFAYLDFDRAGLHGDAAHLFLEVVRQVALQFPGIATAMDGIRDRLRNAPDATDLKESLGLFRELVRSATKAGTFLLVLDTMEVVQYNPQWLQSVIEVAALLHGGEFFGLRIVAAGRADIPELREATDHWSRGAHRTLGPLGVREARDMVSRLGADLMGKGWNNAWAAKVAGGSAQPESRREPLSLRVAVELMRSIEDHSEREAFASEIAETGDAHDSFVGKLYQRRILDHVRDPEVKKLAWPGLVLRTITPSIIRAVLAEPCEIDPGRIEEVFDALGREVWIVRREGEALRHRPDLRARTLPLMRRRDPSKFDRINRAAIEHFAANDSAEGRAEWLYHRLLGGEKPETVDRSWDDKLAPLLAGASDDFHTDLPEAEAYLQARTSIRLLPTARLAKLPIGLAFDHVARAARRMTRLDDVRASDTVLDLAIRADPKADGNPDSDRGPLPEAEAAKQAILIKAGRWRAPALRRSQGNRGGDGHHDFGWSFYAARAGLGVSGESVAILQSQERLVDEFLRSPKASLARARIQDLARFRLEGRDWEALDRAIAEMLDTPGVGPSSPADIAVWRLCAVVGESSVRAAVRHWLRAIDRREVGGLTQSIALEELFELAQCGSTSAYLQFLGPAMRALDIDVDQFWERARRRSRSDLYFQRLRPRFDDSKLVRAVHNLVALLSGSSEPDDRMALRAFFAARSEDWIVPLGYTLLRRHHMDEPPYAVMELLDRHEGGGWLGRLSGRRRARWGDPLVLLRRADEGGQLSEVLDCYRQVPGDEAAEEDFLHLVTLHRRWRGFLSRCVDEGSKGAP
ncbi:MAG TPA: hypothetical protein VE891_14110 [Allosphingosinicella sp.]|nr:hypothetical protein [Allosphingosinicella sp.]